MIDTFRALIANQFEAALCWLNMCVEKCPDALWNAPVGDYKFCQVVFHALFFADYYLGSDEASFRDQGFHLDNAQLFQDYEELEDRLPVMLYDRAALQTYVQHCRIKVAVALQSETEASLAAPSTFGRRSFSRGELYVYNIRHLQDHATQLGGFLGREAAVEIPWVGSGWREL